MSMRANITVMRKAWEVVRTSESLAFSPSCFFSSVMTVLKRASAASLYFCCFKMGAPPVCWKRTTTLPSSRMAGDGRPGGGAVIGPALADPHERPARRALHP